MEKSKGDIHRFFKHSSIYAVGGILNRVGAFLLLPLYTHYLSTSQYGSLEIFYAVMSVIAGILSVGIAHATLRFYYEYDDENIRKSVVSTNYIITFFITTIGCITVYLFKDDLSGFIFSSDEYNNGISIILVTIVFELLSQVCLAFLRAKEKSLLFILIIFIKLIIQVGANSYLIIVYDAGVTGVLFGNLLAVTFGLVALSWYTLKECGLTYNNDIAKSVLKYSYPFLFTTLVGLVSVNVDKFLINHYLSLATLGIYALAFKFSSLMEQLIGEPFNRSYGAFRFSIMKNDDAAHIQSNIVNYLVAIGVTTALILSMLISEVLQFLSGEEYWEAALYVPILAIGSVFKLLSYPSQTGILYSKNTKHIFHVSMSTTIVMVALSFLLLKLYGVIGICIAYVITMMFETILTSLISNKYFKVKYSYDKFVIIVLLSVLAYFISTTVLTENIYETIFIKISIIVGYIVALYYSSFFNVNEKEMIKKYIYHKPVKYISNLMD